MHACTNASRFNDTCASRSRAAQLRCPLGIVTARGSLDEGIQNAQPCPRRRCYCAITSRLNGEFGQDWAIRTYWVPFFRSFVLLEISSRTGAVPPLFPANDYEPRVRRDDAANESAQEYRECICFHRTTSFLGTVALRVSTRSANNETPVAQTFLELALARLLSGRRSKSSIEDDYRAGAILHFIADCLGHGSGQWFLIGVPSHVI